MHRKPSPTGHAMSSIPVAGTAYDGPAWLFSFGAYGSLRLAVFEHHLEGALEQAFEWLDDNAPGELCDPDYAGTAAEMGIAWPNDDDDECEKVREAAEVDHTLCDHTTLKHGSALLSWEWTANEASEEDTAILRGRFCAECSEALGDDPVAWPLCEGCRLNVADRFGDELYGALPLSETDEDKHPVRLWLTERKDGRLEWRTFAIVGPETPAGGWWGKGEASGSYSAGMCRALTLDMLDEACDAMAEERS